MPETLLDFTGFLWGNGVSQEEGIPVHGKIEEARNMGRCKGYVRKPSSPPWPLFPQPMWNMSIDSVDGDKTPDRDRNWRIWNIEEGDDDNGNRCLFFNAQIGPS